MADLDLKKRRLRKRSASLRVGDQSAQSVFIGLALSVKGNEAEYSLVCHDGFGIVETEHDTITVPPGTDLAQHVQDHLIDTMLSYSSAQGYKIELVAVSESTLPDIFRPKAPGVQDALSKEKAQEYKPTLLPAMWLRLDANPFLMPPLKHETRRSHGRYALDAAASYAVQEAIRYLHPFIKASVEARVDPVRRSVQVDGDGLVHLTDLEQSAQISSPQLWKAFMALTQLHNARGTKVAFMSATPSGGGVALMRHALLRLWRQCGSNVEWRVPLGDPAVFQITKGKFHNVMQNKEAPGTQLTDDDKALFEDWTAQNVESFWSEDSPFMSDIVVIDDPQLTAAIPYIRKMNPKAKIIYRSHIQIESHLVDKPGTLQHHVFSYLFQFIKQADLFVAHPVKAFVPKCVKDSMPVVYMPPSTDPLDGLNKPLTKRDTDIYQARFNKMAKEQGNQPVEWNRGYIVQVARFDPSKGYDDLVEAYRLFRKRMDEEGKGDYLPQLVLTGNSSIDDPDGKMIIEKLHEQLAHSDYPWRDDVITVRMPPLDQSLNMILREAWLVCQVSTKEGFEVKVTEAVHKGVPIVCSKAGGIPLQIREGVDGALVEASDSQAMADIFYKKATGAKDLPAIFKGKFRDAEKSEENLRPIGGRWAEEGFGPNEEYFTVANACMWSLLWARLLYGEEEMAELPSETKQELERMGVGKASKENPLEGLLDRVVYSTVAGRESALAEA